MKVYYSSPYASGCDLQLRKPIRSRQLALIVVRIGKAEFTKTKALLWSIKGQFIPTNLLW